MLCLCITGFDVDPQVVSDLLGLAPSNTAIKGQPTPSGRNRHKANGWWLDVHPDTLDGAAHAAAMDTLIGYPRGREVAFQRLKEEVRPQQLTVYGGFYCQADRQAGLWLDAVHMRVLADCGIDWGLDIFVEETRPQRDLK
jgi:hypothetical protein